MDDIELTVQQIDPKATMAKQLLLQGINEQVDDANRDRNQSEHFADKGAGVPLPKQEEETEQQETSKR